MGQACSSTNVSPLISASKSGDADVVARLLTSGTPVDTREGELARTSLHWAARNGHLEVVSILVASGADCLLRDRKNKTPSSLAKSHSNRNCLHILERAEGAAPPPPAATFPLPPATAAAVAAATAWQAEEAEVDPLPSAPMLVVQTPIMAASAARLRVLTPQQPAVCYPVIRHSTPRAVEAQQAAQGLAPRHQQHGRATSGNEVLAHELTAQLNPVAAADEALARALQAEYDAEAAAEARRGAEGAPPPAAALAPPPRPWAEGVGSDMCSVCLIEPATWGALHENTVHKILCRGCAEQLKEQKVKRCPT
eukprot:scaffold6.g2642.t1